MELMREIEEAPESWPEIPGLLPFSNEWGEENLSWVWQRVEAYCRDRWTPRRVTWLVQGAGCFMPPLGPVSGVTVQGWSSGAWTGRSADPSPWGGYALSCDANRITATVGADHHAPAAVRKAAARLANYCAEQVDLNDPDLWATSVSWVRIPETDGEAAPGHKTNESYTRPAGYIAKALQLSGAADLLRPYRRLK